MSGIKGLLFLVAILGGAAALYFRSSVSTEPAQELKAEAPVVIEPQKSPEPQKSEFQEAKIAPAPTETPMAAPKTEAKHPPKLRPDERFRAKERQMAKRIAALCKSGKEKRAPVCDRAKLMLKRK